MRGALKRGTEASSKRLALAEMKQAAHLLSLFSLRYFSLHY